MRYMSKKMIICPAYISKYILNHENQIIVLMIPNGQGWHYLAIKKLSGLSARITLRKQW